MGLSLVGSEVCIRERASSTGTDTRSVGERIRGALGFAKGGKIDGCAKKGHTKGKMR